ncbi:zinc ribbon domain-containing protein [Paenibacillus sp. J2TS4]|uniref:zinc ribbon domain-containing protein n=1 Tax=Paenibacillus sp. J2TS4 TaxID=2807194 RepID=UPI001B25FD98|nr:zinc ribbon domain-containing protein [Paenibacillus sp. J2TS4]GIP35341.1 hypothetical protein J2TS4_45510 [Paenibacillus sp. J2TS4]
MIHCPNCYQPNKDHEKICKECGYFLDEESAAAAEITGRGENGPSPEGAQPASASAQDKWSPYVDKGKVVAKDYWSYALSQLKAPLTNGVEALRSQSLHGWITLGLFVLFFSMANVSLLRSVKVGILSLGLKVPIFKTFIVSFFHISVLVLLTVLMLWVAVKYLMKSSKGFTDVLSRYSALALVPAGLTVVFFLASLIGLRTIALILLVFILIGWIAAVLMTLYSFKQEAESASVDPLYSLFLVFFVICFYLWVAGDSLTGSFSSLILGF